MTDQLDTTSSLFDYSWLLNSSELFSPLFDNNDTPNTTTTTPYMPVPIVWAQSREEDLQKDLESLKLLMLPCTCPYCNK